MSFFHSTAPVPPGRRWGWFHDQDLWGVSGKWCHAQPLQQRLQERGPSGPPSPGGAENGGKGPRWGPQTNTSGTERSGQNRRTGGSCQQEALEQNKVLLGFPGGAVVENLPANARDMGSSPGLGRSHMPRSN